MTNPTNTYTVPSVPIAKARTGASAKANALGMRAMQERAYAETAVAKRPSRQPSPRRRGEGVVAEGGASS